MRIIKRVVILGILMIICLGVYSTFIERALLISKEYNITLNQNGEKNLRVVQFTDPQLGTFYNLDELQKAVNKINSLKPDIVVFTGDLIDNASLYDDIPNISKVLGQIKATIGKFAVYGNHDYGGGSH